jgi:hypothetical protein
LYRLVQACTSLYKKFVCFLMQDVLPDKREAEAQNLRHFVDSMTVTRLDIKEKKNVLAPIFNVYANTQFLRNHLVWIQVRTFLANRTYATNMQGRATVRIAPFNCSLCHSTDHPRGLCPFPEVPGWHGPSRRQDPQNA